MASGAGASGQEDGDVSGHDSGEAGSRRVEELLTRVGLLDDQLDAVHREMYRQQQQIERLAQALGELRRQLQEGGAAAGGEARSEIPPHY